MLRVVHAADLHLDSPLSGLERYEGAPVERLRGATRRALINLIDFCLEEDVKLLLIAGDLYDGNWRDYSTGLFFVGQMARLREASVRVVWIRGNHDAASKLTKHLRLPENVQELPHRRAGSVVFEDWGIAVHGRGYPEPRVTEDLARDYPAPLPGVLNFGLLHTALDGRVGHEPYAPCSLRTLLDRGYDYWALGHVHAREVLHEDPWVVFPGNLQGRQLRESGSKGATLIDVDGARIARVDHVALDVVRWAALVLDVERAANSDDVLELVAREVARTAEAAEGRLVALRVVLKGVTPLHVDLSERRAELAEQVRAIAVDVGGVWLERLDIETLAPLDLVSLRGRDDALGQLATALDELRHDDAALSDLAALPAELRARLPLEVTHTLGLERPEFYRSLISGVEQLLLPRLVSGEEGDEVP